MCVDGAGEISVEANGITTNINALVSDAIQDEMLLSYTDLIDLKIIPGGVSQYNRRYLQRDQHKLRM